MSSRPKSSHGHGRLRAIRVARPAGEAYGRRRNGRGRRAEVAPEERQDLRLERDRLGQDRLRVQRPRRGERPDYDALVLPGGQINPDKLRLEPKAIEIIRGFLDSG